MTTFKNFLEQREIDSLDDDGNPRVKHNHAKIPKAKNLEDFVDLSLNPNNRYIKFADEIWSIAHATDDDGLRIHRVADDVYAGLITSATDYIDVRFNGHMPISAKFSTRKKIENIIINPDAYLRFGIDGISELLDHSETRELLKAFREKDIVKTLLLLYKIVAPYDPDDYQAAMPIDFEALVAAYKKKNNLPELDAILKSYKAAQDEIKNRPIDPDGDDWYDNG